MRGSISAVSLIFVILFNIGFTHNQATIDTSTSNGDSTAQERPNDTTDIPDQNCQKEDDVCQEDLISYEAIKALHRQLDDDESGNIDVSESKEFYRDELQNTDNFERQYIFHGKDDKISVEELWRAWKRSEVYNWTVADVVEWLISSVEMPQYATIIENKAINGTLLPRVAVNEHHYISQFLGIKNAVHKRKLNLKAIDVVLFGPSKKAHNFLKDIALITSIIVALVGCVFAYRQNKSSKEHLKKMMKDLDALQKAEDYLSDLTVKLQKAEEVQSVALEEKKEIEQKYRKEIEVAKSEAERLQTERNDSTLEEMSRLQLAEEELIQVRAALRQAEKELEARCYYGAPSELQQWLQYTFEIEQSHFSTKQQAAQRQFSSAKDACEKMRRKRMGMLGTLRMAQGNSIDDIDQRILQARMAMEDVRNDLQERQQRWVTVENLCGFPIRSNPGLSKLCQSLYGDSGSISSSTSTARLASSLVAPLNVEDADEDFPPQYQAATAMLFGVKPNDFTRSSSSFSDFSVFGTQSNCWPLSIPSRANSFKGLGGNLVDLKRRQVTMGSTSSLSKPAVPQHLANLGSRKDLSHDVNSHHKTTSPTSSNGHHSGNPVSFHLDSPVSSPESPGSDSLSSLDVAPLGDMTRSRSAVGISAIPNGSKIPKRDMGKTSPVSDYDVLSMQRNNSESNLQRRMLQKQAANIGGAGGTQDEDSLSGTESIESEGRKKEKKKLKLIPKFMRKTEN